MTRRRPDHAGLQRRLGGVTLRDRLGDTSLWARLGRSGRNLAATAAAEVAIRLLGLAYLMALARFFEPSAFGVFNTLLAYFALAVTLGNFGLDQLALRRLSVSEGRGVFATLLWLRVIAASITAGLLLAAAALLPTPSAPLFGMLAAAVLPAGVASAYAAGFKARERFGVPSAAAGAATILMASLAFWGVWTGRELIFFLKALVASEVLRAGWLVVAARGHERWSIGTFDAGAARTALREAVPYAALAALGVIYFRVDLIMLDAMVGGAQVGHYAGAYRVLDALILAPGLLLAVLFPRFARGQRDERGEARALYLGVSRILVWGGVAIATTGIVLARPVLTLLFSDAYAEGTASLIWLMTALAFVFWHAPNVTVLFSGDRLGSVVGLSVLTAGFNVVVNALLIPRFGAAGAAAATGASELLSWSIFTPIVLRRLGITPFAYLRAIAIPRMSVAEVRLLLGHDDQLEAHGSDRVG